MQASRFLCARETRLGSVDDLDVGRGEDAGSAPALADPPAVGLLLVHGDEVARAEAELVVEVGRVLVNSAAALEAVFGLARHCHVRRIDVLVVVVLGVAAELVEVAEVLLVGRVLGVAVAGRAVRPGVALLAVAVLRQLQHLQLAVRRVMELERFVLCPRRNLKV